MRNAKASKRVALVVLLALVVLSLTAFSFTSNATTDFAGNSTGVMGDVISNGDNTAEARASSSNIAEFTFRSGSSDYLTVKYPKKITIILGDELGANTGNSPRTSGMYNIDSQTNEQPNVVLEGHYGNAGNTDYQQIIRTGIWGYTGNSNDLFHQYFRDYTFDDLRMEFRGSDGNGPFNSVDDTNNYAFATYNAANNHYVLRMKNVGTYDGMDDTIWLRGTAQKAGTVVYSMPQNDGYLVAFRNYRADWNTGKWWHVDYSSNTYPSGNPTITINVLDPDGLQNVINDAQNRKNNVKGVVEKALVNNLNNAIANANNWVTKARDYTQNFDLNQETLDIAKNEVIKAIEAIENSQKFGVVNGGQYCTSTELRISKSAYDAAGNSAAIAYIDSSSQLTKTAFVWRADTQYEGGGYYYYTYKVDENAIRNKSCSITIAGTNKTLNFNITSWHGFADSSGNILGTLTKDNVLQNGQLATCKNPNHTCIAQVNDLETGQKKQCNCGWSKDDVASKTELWAHVYGEVQTTPSTCNTKGEKYQLCTCGDKKHLDEIALDPNNHQSLGSELVWVAGQKVPGTEIELTEAMHCGYAGKYGHLCSACKKYANEVEKPAGIGANNETIEHVADTTDAKVDTLPTCCDFGTGHYNCQHCGLKARDLTAEEIKLESKLQPTNNHVWESNYFIETPATCTEHAVAYYKCSNTNCSATTTEGIDFVNDEKVKAKGHSMVFETKVEPTCHSKGIRVESCIDCHAEGKTEEIPQVPHEIDRTIKLNEIKPTCMKEGSYEYHCKWYGEFCTEKEVITVSATGVHTRPMEGDPGYLEIEVAPTCTVDGTGYYVCTECTTHVSLDATTEPALKAGHKWSDVDNEKYILSHATCTNAAVYYKSCKVCGEKHTETFVCGEPLGHSFTNYVNNNDATCQKNGTETAKCDRCEMTDTKEINNSILPHKWEFITKEPSTCYSEGKGLDKCTECGVESELKPIEKLDHEYNESIKHNEIAKTCTNDGSYEYYCKNHEHCGAVKKITAKEDPTLQATGHDVEGQTVKVTKDPTCHSLGEGYRLCKKCSAKVKVDQSEAGNFAELQMTEHVIDKTVIGEKVEPTCMKNGSAKYFCKEHKNGCTYFEDIVPTKENGLLALGHSYDNAKTEIYKPATCTEEGIGHKYCTRQNCDDHEGSKIDVKLPIDSNNHIFDESKGSRKEHQVGVCTDPKSSYDYLTCANPKCKGIQVIEGTQQAGEHSWSTILTITKEPTCQADGEGHYECTTCHKTKNAVVSETPKLQKLSHKYVEKVDNKYVKTPATCESQAVYFKSCSTCGEKHATETFVNGEPLGHKFTTYAPYGQATCHSNATEKAKCDRCDKEDIREIPNSMLAHEWKFTETVAPSLENKTDGYDLYTCSLCGDTKKENIVKWETLVPKFTITVEGGTANGQTSVQVNANGTVTLKAEVPEGKVFVGWSDGNKIISYKAEDTIQVTANMSLKAVYDNVATGNNETANNGAVIGGAVGGTVVALLLVGIIIAIVVIVKKRKA